MLFQRSCCLFRFVMFALLILLGREGFSAAPKSPARPAAQTSATVSSRRDIRLEGEIVSFPKNTPLEKLLKKHAVTSRTLAESFLDSTVLREPEAYLLLRPRITICDGSDGAFTLTANQQPGPKSDGGIEMAFLPKIQPDGRVRLDLNGTFYEKGSSVSIIDKARIYRPGASEYHVIGPVTLKKGTTYIFIKLAVVP